MSLFNINENEECIETIHIPFNVPGEKNFIKQGDTIDEIVGVFDEVDPIDLTGAIIEMQVYNGKKKFIDNTSVANAGITILGSKSFKINEVSKEDNNYPYGSFKGDFQITFANGKRKTFYNIIYTIEQEYTVNN